MRCSGPKVLLRTRRDFFCPLPSVTRPFRALIPHGNTEPQGKSGASSTMVVCPLGGAHLTNGDFSPSLSYLTLLLVVRSLHTRLGVMKEMQPLYVATYSEKPAVLEGHPFIVEAGVSLGGADVSSRWIYLAQTIRMNAA